MKPMHIAMALFSAAMFFVLAGVFMGVQLEWLSPWHGRLWCRAVASISPP